jgi:hypothetical protein
MTTAGQQPRGVHLVGSVPLGSAEDVFRTTSTILVGRLRRLPDGETGVRSNWIGWQADVLARQPEFETLPLAPAAAAPLPRFTYGPSPRFKLRAGVNATAIAFGPLGYAQAAIGSYAIFQRLRAEGVIAAGCRFQVSLPTPLAPVTWFIVPSDRAAVEPRYEARLLAEVDEIASAIPSEDLAIQWDTAVEFALLESSGGTPFADVLAGIVERLVRIGDRVPGGVEMGYHLCYGDAGHRHFVQPRDTGTLTAVANAVLARSQRPTNWMHLPVPRDRIDETYFAPLRNLNLSPETELYLGLVHYSDGVAGARRRIAVAQQVVPTFGVATECGFGRRPPETVPDLLRLHAEVAVPIV